MHFREYIVHIRKHGFFALLSAIGISQMIFPAHAVAVTKYSQPSIVMPGTVLVADTSIVVEEIKPVEPERVVVQTLTATVTGFNTVPWQTDNTPCIAASGDDICGRNDVVACPRVFPLYTQVRINEKVYTCLDRLAMKYDYRFDISFDKDIQAALNWGKQRVQVDILQ